MLGTKVTIKATPNQDVKAWDKNNASAFDSTGGPKSSTDKLKVNMYKRTQNRKKGRKQETKTARYKTRKENKKEWNKQTQKEGGNNEIK